MQVVSSRHEVQHGHDDQIPFPTLCRPTPSIASKPAADTLLPTLPPHCLTLGAASVESSASRGVKLTSSNRPVL